MGSMIQSPAHPNGLLRVPASFSPVRFQGGLTMLPTFQTQDWVSRALCRH